LARHNTLFGLIARDQGTSQVDDEFKDLDQQLQAKVPMEPAQTIQILNSGTDPGAREAAAMLLGECKIYTAAPDLLRCTSDPDRLLAASSLISLEVWAEEGAAMPPAFREAVTARCEVILRDNSPRLTSEAAEWISYALPEKRAEKTLAGLVTELGFSSKGGGSAASALAELGRKSKSPLIVADVEHVLKDQLKRDPSDRAKIEELLDEVTQSKAGTSH
jgi:hypothetical protein